METKEEVQNAVPVEVISEAKKPKKERTEKQILSFEKARMVLLEKQKAKLDADLNSIKEKLPSGKKKTKETIAEPVISEAKKPVTELVVEPVSKPKKVKVKVEPPSDSSSEEEEEMTVQKPKRQPKEPKTPRAPKEPQNEIIEPKTPRKPRVKTNETPMNSPIEPTNRNPYSAMLSKYRY
jgi:hypothetical protein